jgi:antitoxin component of MazEF toxin-antitoxin module
MAQADVKTYVTTYGAPVGTRNPLEGLLLLRGFGCKRECHDKTLQKIGNNSYGILIDRPIMDLLHLEPGSAVDVSVTSDGKGLTIRPMSHREQVAQSADRMMNKHEGSAQAGQLSSMNNTFIDVYDVLAVHARLSNSMAVPAAFAIRSC